MRCMSAPLPDRLSQQIAERMLADIGLSPDEHPVDDGAAGTSAGPDPSGVDTEPAEDLAEIYLDPFSALAPSEEDNRAAADASEPSGSAEPDHRGGVRELMPDRPRAPSDASTSEGASRRPAARPAERSRRNALQSTPQSAEAWPNGDSATIHPLGDTPLSPAPSWVDDPEEFDDVDRQDWAQPETSWPAPQRGRREGNRSPRLLTDAGLREPWMGWAAVGAALMLAGVLAGLLLGGRVSPRPPSGAHGGPRTTATAATAARPRRPVTRLHPKRQPSRPLRRRHAATVRLKPTLTPTPVRRTTPSRAQLPQPAVLRPARPTSEPTRAAAPIARSESQVAAREFSRSQVAPGEFEP